MLFASNYPGGRWAVAPPSNQPTFAPGAPLTGRRAFCYCTCAISVFGDVLLVSAARCVGLASSTPIGGIRRLSSSTNEESEWIGADILGSFMTAKAWVHPPWRDRLDFNLPSDIARRTDKFQLIEPGKLSVVDGIKLSFDANAAFAQVEHHWGKPGSSNDNRIRFDGSEQTPRYSAPSRPKEWKRPASFQRSEYKNEMHLSRKLRGAGESSRIARGRVRRPSRGGGLQETPIDDG